MERALLARRGPYALRETLLGGQAFRWRQAGPGLAGFLRNAPAWIQETAGGLAVEWAGEGDLARAAAQYLRVDDPLDRVYKAIAKDARMRAAVKHWAGLHLLAQDPWETTVAFIASSASNVPKIARSLEKVARAFGEPVEFRGERVHALPSAARLARAELADLRRCELGYRARYLRDTARAVHEGALDLDGVARLKTHEAQAALVEAADGVGPKVAACILLFSMGKDDAFPVDRWVQRCVSEWYFGGEAVTHKACEAWGRAYFGPWAGYAQQYLFHDRRSRRPAARGTPRSRR